MMRRGLGMFAVALLLHAQLAAATCGREHHDAAITEQTYVHAHEHKHAQPPDDAPEREQHDDTGGCTMMLSCTAANGTPTTHQSFHLTTTHLVTAERVPAGHPDAPQTVHTPPPRA